MSYKPYFFQAALAAVLLTGCATGNKSVVPTNLRTEYLDNPIGLGTDEPRFTWEYSGNNKSFMPSKYEIRIGTDPGKLNVYDKTMAIRPHTRYYWNVTAWDESGKRTKTSETAFFETGKLSGSDWSAKWITDNHDKEYEPAPLFRKQFKADGKVADARLYIAAAGYYECFINGKRVGTNYLDPGYTHFDKRILYVTHDVTQLLQTGDNAVAVVLGNGWYNEQSVAVWNFHEARWRNRPRMLCELRITYTDGSVATICSDGTWKTSTGPYTYNNIYSGDRFDARLEEKGWKEPSFDDSRWQAAMVTEAPAPLLAAQQMPGIRITEELRPVSMKAFGDSVYVFSFAKNMSGLCRLKVKGDPGTHITLKHGELLKENGRLEQGNINIYYRPVKKGEILQTDEYTLRGNGEEEVYVPSFSYHGFQHVEVICSKPVTLTTESLTALFMHTDIEPAGNFECSNTLLNKIWNATMQSYRSNLHSIPTDCPQREKNGWTADAHVAVDLGLLGFDGITFYEKWMDDIIDNQREDIGDIAGIIPSSGWGYGEFPGPVWDAVMFIIPNALYNYYGEKRSIEKLYPCMLRYLDYLKTKEKDGFLTFGLSDWVFWKAQTNNEYTSTAYYYLDYKLMARFAALLGKDAAPFERKAAELKSRINAKFFNPETAAYAEGTQAAQALALYLGLVPEGREKDVAARLHEIVAANNYFLDFGLIGSKTVPAMLTRYGYVEDVMKMATKTEAPSWGYWVETKGYTTLAETWTLKPNFADASLNHVFMGDISAWMMNNLAGINFDANKPGFRHIRITPHFVKDLDWAKGEYRSVMGLVSSSWKRENGKVVLTVSIPEGTTGEVSVEGRSYPLVCGTNTMSF